MCPSIENNRPVLGTTTKPRVNTSSSSSNIQSPTTQASKQVVKGDNLKLSTQPFSKERLQAMLEAPLPATPPKSTATDWETVHKDNQTQLIQVLRQDDAINLGLKNWKSLNTDLKMQLGKRVSDIQANIFGFTPAPLRVGEGKYHGGYTAGKIDVGPKSMVSAREFLDTVVHEQNHEFQHEKGIANFHHELDPSDPYKQIAKTWLDNFDDYTTPAEGVQAYYAQPIEADSTAMGKKVALAVMAKN